MEQLYNIVVKQLIITYTGGTILYLYYKIKGRKIAYSDILNEVNPKTGLKKHRYKAFYLGITFFIILVIIVSTIAGFNPKLYETTN
ncbi:hypothetical protein ACFQ2E_02485 [Hwangdonia seohaensis]|uniref:Uncharacterized protein n=1 Tax=Hwangdonia seohaensis TaxID=1240727 RepID=A0ABW3R8E6_9FLAO|nr:hypothetical protein [Hwangdonia seohaensis]